MENDSEHAEKATGDMDNSSLAESPDLDPTEQLLLSSWKLIRGFINVQMEIFNICWDIGDMYQ